MHTALHGLSHSARFLGGGPSPSPQPPQDRAGFSCPTTQPGFLAIAEREARRARHRNICQNWLMAKRLSHTITVTDLEAWFINIGEIPQCSLHRLKAIIKIRQTLERSQNYRAHHKINAAIWAEVLRIKPAARNRILPLKTKRFHA